MPDAKSRKVEIGFRQEKGGGASQSCGGEVGGKVIVISLNKKKREISSSKKKNEKEKGGGDDESHSQNKRKKEKLRHEFCPERKKRKTEAWRRHLHKKSEDYPLRDERDGSRIRLRGKRNSPSTKKRKKRWAFQKIHTR